MRKRSTWEQQFIQTSKCSGCAHRVYVGAGSCFCSSQLQQMRFHANLGITDFYHYIFYHYENTRKQKKPYGTTSKNMFEGVLYIRNIN